MFLVKTFPRSQCGWPSNNILREPELPSSTGASPTTSRARRTRRTFRELLVRRRTTSTASSPRRGTPDILGGAARNPSRVVISGTDPAPSPTSVVGFGKYMRTDPAPSPTSVVGFGKYMRTALTRRGRDDPFLAGEGRRPPKLVLQQRRSIGGEAKATVG